MSDSERGSDDDVGPTIEVVYPVGEETEVPRTDGKLFKTVTKEGHGPTPPDGAKVIVHYTGTLSSDGSKFDSSRDRDDPFEFTIGRGQVIKGWDKGVATMRKGERATLRIESSFAYGKMGSPPKIPADAELLFDVELLDWSRSEDVSLHKDRTVMKGARVQGQGWTQPDYESEVTLTIKIVEKSEDGEDGKELVPETELKFTMGDAPDDFPEALEHALKSFKKGETSAVDVEGRVVTADFPALQVKKGSPFRAIVTLQDFTVVHSYDFKGKAKVDEAEKRKAAGNTFFSKSQWEKAVRKYERALEFIESDYGLEGDDLAAAKKLRVPCYTNAAQALLNLRRYKDAIAKCDKCLELEGSNVKALFRRAKAKHASGDWEAALPDIRRAAELEPGNADVQAEFAAIKEKERRQNQADKARYGNLFAKLAAMEEKEQANKE